MRVSLFALCVWFLFVVCSLVCLGVVRCSRVYRVCFVCVFGGCLFSCVLIAVSACLLFVQHVLFFVLWLISGVCVCFLFFMIVVCVYLLFVFVLSVCMCWLLFACVCLS